MSSSSTEDQVRRRLHQLGDAYLDSEPASGRGRPYVADQRPVRRLPALVTAAVLVVAVAVGALLVATSGNEGSSTTQQVAAPVGDEPSEDALSRFHDNLDREREAFAEGETPLLLPAEAAAAYRESYNKMAACYRSNGMTTFEDIAPTFGDGKTPPPISGNVSAKDMDPDTYMKAVEACPFDLPQWVAEEVLTANGVDVDQLKAEGVDLSGQE